MSLQTGILSPLQMRDRQIQDLKTQIANLKRARQDDAEGFQEERRRFASELRKRDDVVQMLQREVGKGDADRKRLRALLKDKDAEIAKLTDQIGVYETRLKKDSTNSDKPQSTNIYKKPVPASSRKKGEKQSGGQPGHKGSTMRPDMRNAHVIERKEGKCACGGEVVFGDQYRARRIVDLHISVHTTEERAFDGVCSCCGKAFSAEHSPAFSAPQKYGDGIKSLVLMLNEYGNVPDKKTAEILRAISGGVITLSDGTVNTMRASAAAAMTETYEAIKNEIRQGNVVGVDESGIRVNGKLHWVIAYVIPEMIYYEHQRRRGEHCSDPDGILAGCTNIVVHDHFRAYYKNTVAEHGECNTHGVRYLIPIIEIHKHSWAEDMETFLLSANRQKQDWLAAGETGLSEEEYAAFETRYLEILDAGDAQYAAATENLTNKKRFREEFCLLKRLREYVKEHLRFLSDFACPFGNNDTERAIHKIKNKTRVSGGFRSDVGANNHMVIASVLMTARLQGKNVLQTIRDEIMPKKQKQNEVLSLPPS